MQEKEKRKRAAAEAAAGPRPRPDPRHPEAVPDTVPRAAGIDARKMSLTCTLSVEGAGGRVASDTRQYRTCGEELRPAVYPVVLSGRNWWCGLRSGTRSKSRA